MNQERRKRKLSAILSADVQGYSRLMSEDEQATVNAIQFLRNLFSGLVDQFNGRVVDSPGDNILAEFNSAVDAVESAIAIQTKIEEKNEGLSPERRMLFRIGINLGDIIVEQDRIYGNGVNIAARIEGLAEGGGICISSNVHEQVKKKVSAAFENMGEHEVKNIAEPVIVYRVKFVQEEDIRPVKALKLPERPSIVVLPFENMSEDPGQEYFSDGLTEDIITDLSKISALFVIARNSSFTYKGKTVNVRQVGRELGVRYVLEGSVRKSADRVRVTSQLINAEEGGHIWAERYDRDLKDIFALQDEITGEIVSALAVNLKYDEQKRLMCKGTTNIKAYEYVLRGSERLPEFTKDAIAYTRRMYEKALELDPEYAVAYSLIGWTHLEEWVLGWTRDIKSVEKAFEFSNKALSLNENSAEAHWVLGSVHLWKRKYNDAIVELEKAISLNPNNADFYAVLGNVLTWAEKYDEAIEMIKKAMRLNPYYPPWYSFRLGQAYCLMGEHDKAVETLKDTLNRDPDLLPVHMFLAISYIGTGQKKEAKAEVAELLRLNPDYSEEVFRATIPIDNQEKMDSIVKSLQKAGF